MGFGAFGDDRVLRRRAEARAIEKVGIGSSLAQDRLSRTIEKMVASSEMPNDVPAALDTGDDRMARPASEVQDDAAPVPATVAAATDLITAHGFQRTAIGVDSKSGKGHGLGDNGQPDPPSLLPELILEIAGFLQPNWNRCDVLVGDDSALYRLMLVSRALYKLLQPLFWRRFSTMRVQRKGAAIPRKDGTLSTSFIKACPFILPGSSTFRNWRSRT